MYLTVQENLFQANKHIASEKLKIFSFMAGEKKINDTKLESQQIITRDTILKILKKN